MRHRARLELVVQNKITALCGNQMPAFQAAVSHVTQNSVYHISVTNTWGRILPELSGASSPLKQEYTKAVFLAYVKVRTEFLQNMIDWHCHSIMRMLPQDRQSATPVFTFSI